MKLDIELVKEVIKTSESFPDLCRNLNLNPNKGNTRSNVERFCKRHNIDHEHFITIKKLIKSKERYNYEKLKTLVNKCKTLKEILLELDLLPITTNYRKLKLILNEYKLEFNYKQNQNFKNKYDKENLIEIVKKSSTYKECFEKLGIRAAGSNYKHLKKYLIDYEIDTSHFNNKNINTNLKIKTLDLLKENSTYSRKSLKKRLYKEGLLKNECYICGQDENWNGMKISLILDHINGIYNDNRIENLRIVCPNCNAGLDTFAGRNNKNKKNNSNLICSCGNKKTKKSSQCKNCFYKKIKNNNKPPIETLIKEVEQNGYCATGRKYGVSDNAIRKWIKTTKIQKNGNKRFY